MTREIRELLPFFANGSLGADERARVEAAIADDPQIAAEARTIEQLRQVAHRMPAPQSPGEFGLARLHRTLDREQGRTAPAARRAFRIEAVAAIAAVTALFVATATVLFQNRTLDYYQASGTAPGYDAARVLTVSFDPAAPLSAVNALLAEAGLTIVDGPSAIGLYRVAAVEDGSLDEIVALLEASGAITSVSIP